MSGSYEELFDRASRAMKEGFADNALVPATEAAKIAPDRWEPRLLLARLWLKMGRADRALSDADAATKIAAGRMPPEDVFLLHDTLAGANLALGNLAAAEESLRVLEAEPDRGDAATRLVALLLSQGKTSDARELLGKAAERHPGPRAERFVRAAEALAANGPEHPDVQLSLAELEIAFHLLDAARARAQKVYAADSANARAEEALRAIAEGGYVESERARREKARTGGLPPALRLGMLLFFLTAGVATLAWTYLNAAWIRSVGQDDRPLMILGALLSTTSLVGLAFELRVRLLPAPLPK